jgi:hypothetical protein
LIPDARAPSIAMPAGLQAGLGKVDGEITGR